MIGDVVYAALCVVVPAVWAVVMSIVFDRVEKRRRRTKGDDEPPSVDYSI